MGYKMGPPMVVLCWIYVWKEGCEMGPPMVVFILFLVDSRILTGHSGSCGGFPTCRAGGTFHMYCGIGGLSWRTSGMYCCWGP